MVDQILDFVLKNQLMTSLSDFLKWKSICHSIKYSIWYLVPEWWFLKECFYIMRFVRATRMQHIAKADIKGRQSQQIFILFGHFVGLWGTRRPSKLIESSRKINEIRHGKLLNCQNLVSIPWLKFRLIMMRSIVVHYHESIQKNFFLTKMFPDIFSHGVYV